MSEPISGDRLRIFYAEEWAALYVDGNLRIVGDTYRTEEEAFHLLGVETRIDDSFMRGQDRREGCAKTLDELAEYRDTREERLIRALELRRQGEELLRQAKEMVSE